MVTKLTMRKHLAFAQRLKENPTKSEKQKRDAYVITQTLSWILSSTRFMNPTNFLKIKD